jgi:hypothetical protein
MPKPLLYALDTGQLRRPYGAPAGAIVKAAGSEVKTQEASKASADAELNAIDPKRFEWSQQRSDHYLSQLGNYRHGDLSGPGFRQFWDDSKNALKCLESADAAVSKRLSSMNNLEMSDKRWDLETCGSSLSAMFTFWKENQKGRYLSDYTLTEQKNGHSTPSTEANIARKADTEDGANSSMPEVPVSGYFINTCKRLWDMHREIDILGKRWGCLCTCEPPTSREPESADQTLNLSILKRM